MAANFGKYIAMKTFNTEELAKIAEACHEMNRAYCFLIGDNSQVPWAVADQWQKESAVKGVAFKLANPAATPQSQHDAWCRDKIEDGWIWGSVKDADAKTHPCLKPYNTLPREQKVKDYIFQAVVKGMTE